MGRYKRSGGIREKQLSEQGISESCLRCSMVLLRLRDPTHLQYATNHPRYLSAYLEKWTFSGFQRKRLPPLVYGLADLSFLVPIR
jgi:hypothetical protein